MDTARIVASVIFVIVLAMLVLRMRARRSTKTQ
jgi:hypothetical protein